MHQLLDPKTDRMFQFLGPETEIMGKWYSIGRMMDKVWRTKCNRQSVTDRVRQTKQILMIQKDNSWKQNVWSLVLAKNRCLGLSFIGNNNTAWGKKLNIPKKAIWKISSKLCINKKHNLFQIWKNIIIGTNVHFVGPFYDK